MYNKSDKRVIIIGGSGLIGRKLIKILSEKEVKTISTCNKNFYNDLIPYDLTKDDISKISKNFKSYDIFIILSAVSNPNWIADNKDVAFNINVTSTRRLIDQIISTGAKIFFMSSVEVFDGKINKNLESTTPNPLNYYGYTKFEIEKYLKNNYNNYCIIRTGWNVGIDDRSRCVIKLTYETLIKDNAKMATDNSFTITHVEDLAVSISKILFTYDKNIVHLCCPKIIYRNELADMIKKFSKYEKKMNYKSAKFEEILYSEKRALKNNLDSEYLNLNRDYKFRNVELTVKEKVEFLDKIYDL